MTERTPSRQKSRSDHLKKALVGTGILVGLGLAYISLNSDFRRRARERAQQFGQELQGAAEFVQDRRDDVESVVRRAQQGVTNQIQESGPHIEKVFGDTIKHIGQEFWHGLRRDRQNITPEQYITIKEDRADDSNSPS